jgi:hypothetical protein
MCPKCGEKQTLASTDVQETWPRKLIYVCPNGHRNLVPETTDPRLIPPPAPTDPSLPIRYTYRVQQSPEYELELFRAAGTIRRKLGRMNPKAHAYINLLEQYVNGAIIQFGRIQEASDHLSFLFTQAPQHPSDTSKLYALPTMIDILFLDLHFWIICLEKVENLYDEGIRSELHRLGLTSEIRPKRKIADHRFKKALAGVDEARNFLEHIEKEVRKGMFEGLRHEKDANGEKFICGGHSVTLDPHLLSQAYEALIEWIRSLPDLD